MIQDWKPIQECASMKVAKVASRTGANEPVTNGIVANGTMPMAITFSALQWSEPWLCDGFGPTYASLTVPTM